MKRENSEGKETNTLKLKQENPNHFGHRFTHPRDFSYTSPSHRQKIKKLNFKVSAKISLPSRNFWSCLHYPCGHISITTSANGFRKCLTSGLQNHTSRSQSRPIQDLQHQSLCSRQQVRYSVIKETATVQNVHRCVTQASLATALKNTIARSEDPDASAATESLRVDRPLYNEWFVCFLNRNKNGNHRGNHCASK